MYRPPLKSLTRFKEEIALYGNKIDANEWRTDTEGLLELASNGKNTSEFHGRSRKAHAHETVCLNQMLHRNLHVI